ncbi:hypothetical protein [Enterobacter cancerogenus]|uniref:hypothetical protein n=1 Tax=Enterobacter cancerogenus TaxID=69218 RepID=UPI000FDB0A7E|nr:hypothetical protein [Enterobacter cancerogenus]
MKKIVILLSIFAATSLSINAFAQDDVNPAVANEDCAAAFNISSAAQSCIRTTAKAVGDHSCNIKTSCRNRSNTGNGFKDNNVTLPYSVVSSLANCGGTLKTGGC